MGQPSRLHWLALLAYGLPALPLAALTLPVTLYLPTLYADTLGLGLTATGFALLLARLWDVVTDPLVGTLSDRLAHKPAGRLLWITAGLPLTMLGAWFLLVPPDSVGFWHLLVWSLLLYLGWTMMILPLQAWGSDIATDTHERSRITASREGAAILGVLVPLGLIAALGLASSDTGRGALFVLAVFILVALPVSVAAMWLAVPRRTADLAIAHAERPSLVAFWRGSATLFTGNRPFRLLLTSFFVNSLANALPATLFFMYVTHVLEAADSAGPLLFLYFICGFAGIPLWVWLAGRYGKRPVWSGAMGFACAAFLIVPFLGSGDVWAFAVMCVLTGLCVGADLVLPASMQADVVARDEQTHGQNRAGLFFGLWGITSKLALALAAGLFLPLLDGLGFTTDGNGALWPLVLLYSLVPIGFKLLAVWLMRSYHLPVDEK